MKVLFFAYVRDYTGAKETEVGDCSTVEELINKLCHIYGKKFENKVLNNNELSSEIIILVNGRHIFNMDGVKTKLKESDVVSIFPVVAGG